MSMPKEKILYVCDDKHNGQDAPLELKESVPYPENVHYGEKDSIHYYYQCPSCLKTYLAYQRMGKPLEWTTPDKEVWEKRITTVREGRVSILRKGLDEGQYPKGDPISTDAAVGDPPDSLTGYTPTPAGPTRPRKPLWTPPASSFARKAHPAVGFACAP